MKMAIKQKNDIIQKEKNSNSSIFDIVYNEFFNNYISGEFFSKLSDNKTIFYVKTDYSIIKLGELLKIILS